MASVLPGQPATPIEGDAGGGGQGVHTCTTPSLLLSTPGEGEAGRRGEGVRSCCGIDRLSCWVAKRTRAKLLLQLKILKYLN